MTKELENHGNRNDRNAEREAAQKLFIEAQTRPTFAFLARHFHTSRQAVSLWAKQDGWRVLRVEYWQVASQRIVERSVEARLQFQDAIFDVALKETSESYSRMVQRLNGLMKNEPNEPDQANLWQDSVDACTKSLKTLMETMKETVRKPLDVNEMINAMLGSQAGSE